MTRWFGRINTVLLTGLFALAASGDDFNLLRLALPSPPAQATGGELPLDDPNSDFTRPEETRLSADQGVRQGRCPETISRPPFLFFPGQGSNNLLPRTASPGRVGGPLTPLRC